MAVYPDIRSYAWMPDLSANNGPDIDISGIAAGGASAFMFRCSSGLQLAAGSPSDMANFVDPQFSNYIQRAYDTKRPAVAYHYFVPGVAQSPTRDTDYQFQALLAALKNKAKGISYHGICLDLEEEKYIDTNTNTLAKVQRFYAWLQADPATSGLPVFFYSSFGWLSQYPAVSDWLSYPGANRLLIMAQWLHDPKNGYLQVADIADAISRYWPSPSISYSIKTPGFATWTAWQFEVCLLNSLWGNHQIDFSIFHFSQTQLYQLLGYNQAAPPVPPIPPAPSDDLAARIAAVETKIHGINIATQ